VYADILIAVGENAKRPDQKYLPEEIYRHDFADFSRHEKNGRVKIRLLSLFHIQKGKSYQETADILQVAHTAPKRWVKRLDQGGLSALQEQPGRGRKRKLEVKSQEDFVRQLNSCKRADREAGLEQKIFRVY
jgi:transposase-like protein